ncbi:MAG: hypothetical protein WDM86_05125 [Rhizomicrobium sp.]
MTNKLTYPCRLLWAGLVVLLALGVGAHASNVRDLDPKLQRIVACMIRTAKRLPGVDHVRLTLTDSQSVFNGGPSWLHPLVSYRATERPGDGYVVTFDAARSGVPGNYEYSFSANLPGLALPGQRPSDWKSGDVIGLWRSRCRAEASAVFN